MKFDEAEPFAHKSDELPRNLYSLRDSIEQEMAEVVDHILEDHAYAGINLKEFLDCMERHLLIRTLSHFGGNQKKTSEFLDLKPTTMNAKCKKYQIKFVKHVL
jgi:DNA-binding NtrC family response regulator